MKRFYKEVSVGRVPGESGVEGYQVLLDSRPIKTPGKAPLVVPAEALADAIAREWAGQGEEVRPQAMAQMTMACTAIDLIAPRRAVVIDELTEFGETDLVCYRAAEPPELVERQRDLWQPLVDWAALALDAPLRVTHSILPESQHGDAVKALRQSIERHDDFALAGLAVAIKVAGSLVIGLALSQGHVDAEAAFEAAELDTSYQIEQWGEDAEAQRRRDGVRAELASADKYLRALRGG